MKKNILFIIISLSLIIFMGYTVKTNARNNNDLVEDISSKIIRFHVIANSDSKEDQELKLKVRDRVLDYISPKLKNCKSIKESRKIITKYNDNIIKIANEVIRENGYKHSVKSTLSRENFPVKTYGNITLPQGNYEAYRIIIGNGKGHNWWCVMFPPLCFVDVTKSEVNEDKVETKMKNVLSDEEYDCINNTNKSKIKFKFKIAEVLSRRE